MNPIFYDHELFILEGIRSYLRTNGQPLHLDPLHYTMELITRIRKLLMTLDRGDPQGGRRERS